MRRRSILGALILTLALISTGCKFEQREVERIEAEEGDTVVAGRTDTSGMMAHDPQMMYSMMQDSTSRRAMMQNMMRDTVAMRTMMTDSAMVRLMGQQMAANPDLMRTHMRAMLEDPQHRDAMLQVVRQDTTVRERLRGILAEAGAP